jgi:hypothetical protein
MKIGFLNFSKGVFWVSVLMILVIVYALTVTVILPVTKHKEHPAFFNSNDTLLNETAVPEEVAKDTLNKMNASRQMVDLILEDQYLTHHKQLSNADSIYLSVNLRDSLLILMIKGVPVHYVKMEDYTFTGRSLVYESLPGYTASSEDFMVTAMDATVDKYPIVKKTAPESPEHAEEMAAKAPEMPVMKDIYVSFYFKNHLTLSLKQSEPYDKEGLKKMTPLKRKALGPSFIQSLKALFSNDQGLFHPHLEIVIPRKDATVIYRALPDLPNVVILFHVIG